MDDIYDLFSTVPWWR